MHAPLGLANNADACYEFLLSVEMKSIYDLRIFSPVILV